MSFYVRRSPGPCDPRTPIMGHVNLNGIQTPPARLYFDSPDPPTAFTPWTYRGPLGMNIALDNQVVDFITPDCEPQFVVWEATWQQQFQVVTLPVKVRVEKTDTTLNPFGSWDTYLVRLWIDNVEADEAQVAGQQFAGDYSEYVNLGGPQWFWGGDEDPTQTVNAAKFWPCAWDRVLPGPPFVPL